MGLPSIRNSKVAKSIDEAATLERFAVQVIPPQGIVVPSILSEEIVSIGGLEMLDKMPEIVRQISLGHTRVFSSSFVEDTTIELNMVMNLNFSGAKANDMLIYKMWKQWARRHRNEFTGANSLKIDTVGNIIIDQHNKVGEVWRHVELINVLIMELTGLDETSIESQEPVQLTVNLVAEGFNVIMGG